ncbi:hypothetical protein [Rubritalea tangerina]|uniref:hypothetical protein n=1 Tax=Rubritalea tangerina TaxID=430798 RepID=UPI00360D6DAA
MACFMSLVFLRSPLLGGATSYQQIPFQQPTIEPLKHFSAPLGHFFTKIERFPLAKHPLLCKFRPPADPDSSGEAFIK